SSFNGKLLPTREYLNHCLLNLTRNSKTDFGSLMATAVGRTSRSWLSREWMSSGRCRLRSRITRLQRMNGCAFGSTSIVSVKSGMRGKRKWWPTGLWIWWDVRAQPISWELQSENWTSSSTSTNYRSDLQGLENRAALLHGLVNLTGLQRSF